MIKLTGAPWHEFEILRTTAVLDASGRINRQERATGRLTAIAAGIEPQAHERAGGTEHPMVHRLVARGTPDLRAGDILRREGERCYVHGVRDVGMMGLFTVVLCERR